MTAAETPEKKMFHGELLFITECDALVELEEVLGKAIPRVEHFK